MNETQSIPNYSSKFTSAFELKSEKQIQKEQQKKKEPGKLKRMGSRNTHFQPNQKKGKLLVKQKICIGRMTWILVWNKMGQKTLKACQN